MRGSADSLWIMGTVGWESARLLPVDRVKLLALPAYPNKPHHQRANSYHILSRI